MYGPSGKVFRTRIINLKDDGASSKMEHIAKKGNNRANQALNEKQPVEFVCI